MVSEDFFQGEVQLMLLKDTLPHRIQSNTYVSMVLQFIRIGSKVGEGGSFDFEIDGLTIHEYPVHVKYDGFNRFLLPFLFIW
ncbi:hypothetical protein D3C85_1802430 [compost metagenome]